MSPQKHPIVVGTNFWDKFLVSTTYLANSLILLVFFIERNVNLSVVETEQIFLFINYNRIGVKSTYEKKN